MPENGPYGKTAGETMDRAKSAAFGAAQAKANEQGVHLLPHDRPLFDAAVEAALAVYQPPGAVEALREIEGFQVDDYDDRDYCVARMRGMARFALQKLGGQ